LVKDNPHCDANLRSYLGRAYDLKAIADYETEPGSEIPPERAIWAIGMATRFVAFVETLLPGDTD
jgi:hypothetical protein